MNAFITVLILIVCLLLVIVVLVQNPKGGGLASGFSSANQIGGVRKTTDFLEKATWGLLIFLVVLSLITGGGRQDQGDKQADMYMDEPMQTAGQSGSNPTDIKAQPKDELPEELD